MNSPVYIKIANGIRSKIETEELMPGDNLPSEAALCKEYGTSRMTVRKSLGILTNENYIYSIPGKGYFVKKPEYNKYIIYYDEMTNLINNVDNAKLLEVDIINPSKRLSDTLQINMNKKIVAIRRVFYTDEIPVAYDIKYILYQKGMPIVEKEIEQATFPEMVSRNTTLYGMKKELMISAKVPKERTKKLLNLLEEQALLVVEQKLYDNNDKPIGVGITYYRGDYIKLQGMSQ